MLSSAICPVVEAVVLVRALPSKLLLLRRGARWVFAPQWGGGPASRLGSGGGGWWSAGRAPLAVRGMPERAGQSRYVK